jgi:hypothetical protein
VNAAAKAGAACSKAGKTSVVSRKTFTCVKSGKKLVWDKGVVTKPTSIATPIPAPIQAPTPDPIPTPKAEIVPAFPTSFKDLEINSEGIPYASWASVQSNIKLFPEPKTKVSLFFGPNTPKRYPDEITERMVLLGSRVMGNIPQPKEIKFYNFNKVDVPWAKEATAPFVSPFRLGESLPQQVEGLCAREDCDGGITNYVSGIGVVIVAISTPVTRYGDAARLNGQIDLHEYVHAVQGLVFANKTSEPPPVLIPCWYSEGQPQAVSILTSAATMSDYIKLRTSTLKNNRWPLVDSSATTIEKFLADNMKVPCPGSTNSANYTAGFIVMETLISIGGVERTFDLLKSVADGAPFQSAFEKHYQLPWLEAAPIVARIVSKVVSEARK